MTNMLIAMSPEPFQQSPNKSPTFTPNLPKNLHTDIYLPYLQYSIYICYICHIHRYISAISAIFRDKNIYHICHIHRYLPYLWHFATLMSHDPLQQQSPNRSRNWAFPLIYHAQILTLPLTTDLPKNIKESSRGLFLQKLCTKMSVGDKSKKKGGTLSPDLRGSTDKWSFGGKRKIKVKELSVVWINT